MFMPASFIGPQAFIISPNISGVDAFGRPPPSSSRHRPRGPALRSGRPRKRRASSGVQSTSTVTFMAPHLSRLLAGAPSKVYRRRAAQGRMRHGRRSRSRRWTATAASPPIWPSPKARRSGAIVVIQEIFGVNEGIRRKCDHWAALGYLARRAGPVLAARARGRARSRRARAVPAGARPDAAGSTRTRASPTSRRRSATPARGCRRAARSAASAIAWAAGSPS